MGVRECVVVRERVCVEGMGGCGNECGGSTESKEDLLSNILFKFLLSEIV